jgi:hypothetical protein
VGGGKRSGTDDGDEEEEAGRGKVKVGGYLALFVHQHESIPQGPLSSLLTRLCCFPPVGSSNSNLPHLQRVVLLLLLSITLALQGQSGVKRD